MSVITLSETEKSYLAGLIDGEGCLTITYNVGKFRERPCHYPVMMIANSDVELLDWKEDK